MKNTLDKALTAIASGLTLGLAVAYFYTNYLSNQNAKLTQEGFESVKRQEIGTKKFYSDIEEYLNEQRTKFGRTNLPIIKYSGQTNAPITNISLLEQVK